MEGAVRVTSVYAVSLVKGDKGMDGIVTEPSELL